MGPSDFTPFSLSATSHLATLCPLGPRSELQPAAHVAHALAVREEAGSALSAVPASVAEGGCGRIYWFDAHVGYCCRFALSLLVCSIDLRVRCVGNVDMLVREIGHWSGGGWHKYEGLQ